MLPEFQTNEPVVALANPDDNYWEEAKIVGFDSATQSYTVTFSSDEGKTPYVRSVQQIISNTIKVSIKGGLREATLVGYKPSESKPFLVRVGVRIRPYSFPKDMVQGTDLFKLNY